MYISLCVYVEIKNALILYVCIVLGGVFVRSFGHWFA